MLRAKFQMPPQPQLAHVIKHLLWTAHHHAATFAAPSPPQVQLLKDVDRGYRHIVKGVHELLSANADTDATLTTITRQLAGESWVLTEDGKFVLAEELCFSAEADRDEGIFLLSTVTSTCVADKLISHCFVVLNTCLVS